MTGLAELLARLPELALAHLQLALSALALAIALSVPLGILASRDRRVGVAILGAVNVLQTVPSLALLAFMVPAIGAIAPLVEAATGFRPSSIGAGPALVALTAYGLLPILQNTVAGLRAVDPALVEAAQGVGMDPRQRLFRVELPLAVPVIIAGTRTAAAWVVGTAVLATPVGASSLGDYIFVGLQTRNHLSIAVGCLASAALALVLDGWIRAVEVAVAHRSVLWMRILGVGLGGAWLVTVLPWMPGKGRADVRIGAKAFTEAYVMAEVFGQQLEQVGLAHEQVGSLGSTVIFDALVAGDLDLYLDFTGTILVNAMGEAVPNGGPEATRERVRQWLLETHDVRIAAVLGYENRYAFAVRRLDAERLALRTLSDLRGPDKGLSLVASYEFFDRPEWASVVEQYGLRFGSRTTMEQALAYEAVRSKARDVVVAYSTDARIEAFDLALLADDRHAIPPYEAIVLVRGDFADARPEAMEALAELAGSFSEASVRRLNRLVDEEGYSSTEAARVWMKNR